MRQRAAHSISDTRFMGDYGGKHTRQPTTMAGNTMPGSQSIPIREPLRVMMTGSRLGNQQRWARNIVQVSQDLFVREAWQVLMAGNSLGSRQQWRERLFG